MKRGEVRKLARRTPMPLGAARGVVGLQPLQALEPGRYLLDQDGRLHPERFRGFIRAVALVTVRRLPAQEIAADDVPTADRAGGCDGSAPEGTSRASDGEHENPANADQPPTQFTDPPAKAGLAPPVSRAAASRGAAVGQEYRAKAGVETDGTVHASPRPSVEPVSRPAAGRSAAATSEPMDVTAGETAPDPDDDEPVEIFAEALARVRGRKATSPAKPAPKIDWTRVSRAHASKVAPAPARKARPLQPALSREECKRCGVPGWKGCEHQLPYDEAAA